MARSVEENLRQHAVHRRNNVFAEGLFLKIKRGGKGLTQGYSADEGSGYDGLLCSGEHMGERRGV